VVDEVLAVGDAQFQKKCLGKMGEVGREGRTVLFVSHHMPSIQRLCIQSILLKNGHLQTIGRTENIVASYLSNAPSISSSEDLTYLPKSRRHGNGLARFIRIDLFALDGRSTNEISHGEPFTIRLQIKVEKMLEAVLFGFSFVAADGTEIMGSTARDCGITDRLETGIQTFSCKVDPMILNPGRYYIRAAIFRKNEVFDHIDELIAFDVLNVAHNLLLSPVDHLVGMVYVPFEWRHD
jgi:lipopolysaccharide transport system ATP-binding protein